VAAWLRGCVAAWSRGRVVRGPWSVVRGPWSVVAWLRGCVAAWSRGCVVACTRDATPGCPQDRRRPLARRLKQCREVAVGIVELIDVCGFSSRSRTGGTGTHMTALRLTDRTRRRDAQRTAYASTALEQPQTAAWRSTDRVCQRSAQPPADGGVTLNGRQPAPRRTDRHTPAPRRTNAHTLAPLSTETRPRAPPLCANLPHVLSFSIHFACVDPAR